MMKKGIITLFIALLLLPRAFAAGKGEAEAGSTAQIPQKIVFVVGNEADKLDPGTSAETFADPIIVNCFEGLVRTDQNETPQPGVAESWEISSDGLVYTFHLRQNARWSDGKELTAEDFAYAWKRVLDPGTGSDNAAMLYSYIKNGEPYYKGQVSEEDLGIRVMDKHTLQVTIEAPTPYMLLMFAFRVYFPVRRDMVAKDPDAWHRNPETYLCNGPFKVVAMNFGESIVLGKNDHYWNAEQVKMQEVTLRLIPELSTALTAMEAGDIDGLLRVPPAEIPRLRVERSDIFYTLPALSTSYYLSNNQKKPLDDVRVRKALSLALNRQALVDNVTQGGEIPAFGIVPPGLAPGGKDFRESGGSYGLSAQAQVEEARKLLAEAGYPNGENFPPLVLSYYATPLIKKEVEAIHQMWKKNLNIDLEIKSAEWKVYYQNVKNMDYDIGAMGWGGDYAHPMTFLAVFTSESANNLTNWGSQEYDNFIKMAQNETNPDRVLEYLHGAEDLLINEMRILTMYHRTNTMMMAQHVKGWRRSVLGSIFFENAYVVAK